MKDSNRRSLEVEPEILILIEESGIMGDESSKGPAFSLLPYRRRDRLPRNKLGIDQVLDDDHRRELPELTIPDQSELRRPQRPGGATRT